MSMFSYLGCLFNRHKPHRRDVRWDGRRYVGTCRYCGTEIQRRGRRLWRKRSDAFDHSDNARA